jgi:CheY-like chemotaxis protein
MAETKEQSTLVVDDNPDDRKLFRRMLESAGYSVVERSSGKEAFTAVEKTSLELMTLDLGMPDTDGFDVLQTVLSKHPELKIIVVFGFRQGSMKSLGAAATLDKNLATALLLPMVCDLLTHLDGPC